MSFARVRAFVVIGVLGVLAVVFVIVALVRDSQGGTIAATGCPAGAVTVDVTLPDKNDEVTVKIFNGTGSPGVADNVTNDFKNRSFKVQKPGESPKKLDGVAQVTYGPAAVGSAQVVSAYFLGDAKMQYNAKRKGAVVDIVVGTGYRQLATPTEVKQALIELGEPELPVGACPAPAKKK